MTQPQINFPRSARSGTTSDTTTTGPAYPPLQAPWEQHNVDYEVRRHQLAPSRFVFTGGDGKGYCKLFIQPIHLVLQDCRIISGPDEYHSLALTLNQEQYAFLVELQEMLKSRFVTPDMTQWPDAYKPKFNEMARMSANQNPYVKLKIKTQGKTITFGNDLNGDSPVTENVTSILGRGREGNFIIAIDGVYVTSKGTGLVSRLECFRIVKEYIPEFGSGGDASSEPDREQDGTEFQAKRQRMLTHL